MKSDKSVSVNCRCSEYKEINNPASYFKGAGTLERREVPIGYHKDFNLSSDM